MWDATFPRLTHAGLGKPINEDNILMSMHDNPAWVSLGNVVSHMACFTRGAKVRATCNCEMCNVCHCNVAVDLWVDGHRRRRTSERTLFYPNDDLVTSKKWDVLEALFVIHQKQVLLNGRTSYWDV